MTTRDPRTGRFVRPVPEVDDESAFDPMADSIEDIDNVSGAPPRTRSTDPGIHLPVTIWRRADHVSPSEAATRCWSRRTSKRVRSTAPRAHSSGTLRASMGSAGCCLAHVVGIDPLQARPAPSGGSDDFYQVQDGRPYRIACQPGDVFHVDHDGVLQPG
jgi:hypothetical protein